MSCCLRSPNNPAINERCILQYRIRLLSLSWLRCLIVLILVRHDDYGRGKGSEKIGFKGRRFGPFRRYRRYGARVDMEFKSVIGGLLCITYPGLG